MPTHILSNHPTHAQIIQRIGHWLLDPFGTAYIEPGFSPEGLLALGFWAGAAQKDFGLFWAERFHVAVPEELVQLLMPQLAQLEAEVQAAKEAAAGQGADARERASKAEARVRVLRVLVVAAVQDALELAQEYSSNRVHALLWSSAAFK